MMLTWLGLVLTVGTWQFASTIVAPARPAVALAMGALAAVCLLAGVSRSAQIIEPNRRGRGLLAGLAGIIAVAAAQWIVHAIYWRVSPFYHVSVGSSLLAQALRLVGADAVASAETVSIQLMSTVIHVRPSLERLGVYPLTMLWVGGLTLRVVAGGRWRILTLLGSLAAFVAYACGRFAVLSLLSGDLESPPLFWNPWISVASLIPLGILASAVMPIRSPTQHSALSAQHLLSRRRLALGGTLAFIGAASAVFGLHAERAGQRKQGRILLDDLHSGHWEMSTGEFNEQSYGEKAIYNYICLRDWLSQFYTVRVNTEARISDDLLREVDVLVLKTPTQPFLQTERDAIERFVNQGGGLWLIGDHTNLYGMSTYLNPIADVFGFRVHSDDTFDNNTGQPSVYQRPVLARHPAVAPLEEMEFETSATLAAPLLARPVMIGYQLGKEMVDYGHVNFFGNITVDHEDEYGLFLQAVAVEHGRGRVLAFADSTVFSSFSMFLPGIPELAEGSVAYLNHTEPGRVPLWVLAGLGLLMCAAADWSARSWRSAPGMFLLVVGMAGGSIAGGLATTAHNTWLYPGSESKDIHRRAVVDTSISSFRLPSSLEYDVIDPERCFDALYLNLARLGLHPKLAPALGPDVPTAPLRIFIQPTRAPREEDLAELRRYVEGGGRLIILESSVHVSPATRKLLERLDLHVKDSPGGPVLEGGERMQIPAANKPRTPNTVAACQKTLGAGKIMCILGGEWFSRKYMGQVYGLPDPLEREFHNLQYYLFHQFQGTEHVARTR